MADGSTDGGTGVMVVAIVLSRFFRLVVGVTVGVDGPDPAYLHRRFRCVVFGFDAVLDGAEVIFFLLGILFRLDLRGIAILEMEICFYIKAKTTETKMPITRTKLTQNHE